MFPEQLSMHLIKLMADEIDIERNGAAIEIGVGTGNFYSLVYKNLGFHTIAVDPIAYEPFLELSSEHGIVFDESCIYTKNGEQVLYTSMLTDLSSLNRNWWGINDGTSKIIKAQNLETFIRKHNIKKIAFFKVDTEGTEYEIIEQFERLNNNLYPDIMEFEYGGGGLKKDRKGGWEPLFFNKTLKILELLKKLNYREALILDSNELEPYLFSLENSDNFESIFKPYFDYGNLIAFKNKIIDSETIFYQLISIQNTLLKEYIENLKKENTQLKNELIKKDYLKRISNKIKRTFKIK